MCRHFYNTQIVYIFWLYHNIRLVMYLYPPIWCFSEWFLLNCCVVLCRGLNSWRWTVDVEGLFWYIRISSRSETLEEDVKVISVTFSEDDRARQISEGQEKMFEFHFLVEADANLDLWFEDSHTFLSCETDDSWIRFFLVSAGLVCVWISWEVAERCRMLLTGWTFSFDVTWGRHSNDSSHAVSWRSLSKPDAQKLISAQYQKKEIMCCLRKIEGVFSQILFEKNAKLNNGNHIMGIKWKWQLNKTSGIITVRGIEENFFFKWVFCIFLVYLNIFWWTDDPDVFLSPSHIKRLLAFSLFLSKHKLLCHFISEKERESGELDILSAGCCHVLFLRRDFEVLYF